MGVRLLTRDAMGILGRIVLQPDPNGPDTLVRTEIYGAPDDRATARRREAFGPVAECVVDALYAEALALRTPDELCASGG